MFGVSGKKVITYAHWPRVWLGYCLYNFVSVLSLLPSLCCFGHFLDSVCVYGPSGPSPSFKAFNKLVRAETICNGSWGHIPLALVHLIQFIRSGLWERNPKGG